MRIGIVFCFLYGSIALFSTFYPLNPVDLLDVFLVEYYYGAKIRIKIRLYKFQGEKKSMSFYLDPKAKVLSDLEATENGLSSAEAQSRIEKYGKNKLAEGKKESLIHRFFKQLAEPMTIILLVAAATLFSACSRKARPKRLLKLFRKSPPQPPRLSVTADRSPLRARSWSLAISSFLKQVTQFPQTRVLLSAQA